MSSGRHRADLDAERPDLAQLRLHLRHVPFLEHVAGRVLVDEPLDHALHLVAGDLRHVAAFEDLAAVFVDDAALLVHHVVVLEHPFADQEVLLLDLLLGVLDGLGQHARLFERHLLALVVDRAEPVEDLVDAVAGEEADHVVFGGEEEAGLPGSPWRPERPRSWLSMRRDS